MTTIEDIDGQEPSCATNGARTDRNSATAASTLNGTHRLAAEPTGSPSQNGRDGGASRALRDTTYYGHDREEVTRLMIQALHDLGYEAAADAVSKESGYELESTTVTKFRDAVHQGQWDRVESLLEGAIEPPGNGLVLAPVTDVKSMFLMVKEQKYMELVERDDTVKALHTLRHEVTPLASTVCPERLGFISSLLMCSSPADVRKKAEWNGAAGGSRQQLLSKLSKCIAPSVMVPEKRLSALLHQVKNSQVNSCLFHTSPGSPSLYSDHWCDRSNFPSEVVQELDEHANEVWQVLFSHDGTRMASCGKDETVIIWEVPSFRVLHTLPGHSQDQGVANLAWSPDDQMLITCGRDNYARLWSLEPGNSVKELTPLVRLEPFKEPVSGAGWLPDSSSVYTGSFDKEKAICEWEFRYEDPPVPWTWDTKGKQHRVEDLDVSPDGRWLVAMDYNSSVYVYSTRSQGLVGEVDLKKRPTSITISRDSTHVLVSTQDGEAQLIDLDTRQIVKTYSGAKGGDYIIRSSLGGANDSFVISGSEDGSIYIWHKFSAVLVAKLDGHHPRTNAVSWNPTNPCMFASCGDDHKIKIWSNYKPRPTGSGPNGHGRVSDDAA